MPLLLYVTTEIQHVLEQKELAYIQQLNFDLIPNWCRLQVKDFLPSSISVWQYTMQQVKLTLLSSICTSKNHTGTGIGKS